MNKLKEKTEQKINTIVSSPILPTSNKITTLKDLKNKLLSHKMDCIVNDNFSNYINQQENKTITNSKEQAKVYEKVSTNMKKAGLTSPLMLMVMTIMLATSFILIGIIIGSFF